MDSLHKLATAKVQGTGRFVEIFIKVWSSFSYFQGWWIYIDLLDSTTSHNVALLGTIIRVVFKALNHSWMINLALKHVCRLFQNGCSSDRVPINNWHVLFMLKLNSHLVDHLWILFTVEYAFFEAWLVSQVANKIIRMSLRSWALFRCYMPLSCSSCNSLAASSFQFLLFAICLLLQFLKWLLFTCECFRSSKIVKFFFIMDHFCCSPSLRYHTTASFGLILIVLYVSCLERDCLNCTYCMAIIVPVLLESCHIEVFWVALCGWEVDWRSKHLIDMQRAELRQLIMQITRTAIYGFELHYTANI